MFIETIDSVDLQNKLEQKVDLCSEAVVCFFFAACQLATTLFRIIPPRPIRYFTNDHLIPEKCRPTYGILTMH